MNYLSKSEIKVIVNEALCSEYFDDKKILLVVPDATRSCPLPLMFEAVFNCLAGRSQLDVMIALGTHPPMTTAQIMSLMGISEEDYYDKYKDVNFINHHFNDPTHLTSIGKLAEDKVASITKGLFKQEINVEINKHIMDYDHIIICGPVFPHEVVGFSGGHKYFFPGISGREITDFFHWLGAVLLQKNIIGEKNTLVRDVIEEAAKLVKIPHTAFCMVVNKDNMYDLFYGDTKETWEKAANLSIKVHIEYKEKKYKTVLSCAPKMYEDIWTAGKCMYKLEPILDEYSTLIIYAPHITEVSVTHGEILKEIGYHTRDYFLGNWGKFKDYPWGVLAHSTHVKGFGTYENGIEKPNANVVLATGISKEECEKINLGYMNPNDINIADYKDREDEGILYVPSAGEVLFKLK